jgi:hypothetical protein
MIHSAKNNSIFTENKPVVFISLFLLIITFLGYIYSWYTGVNQVISWQILSELGDKMAIVDRFTLGNQAFELPAKVYFVTEQYVASNMSINQPASYIWLVIYGIALSFLMAISTKLSTYLYYGANVGIILTLVSLNFDTVLGSSNYLYSGIILAVYIAINYYFFAFKTDSSLIIRFIAFALFFVIISFLVTYLPHEPLPFLFLASQSIPSAMVLSCLFIFWIAYEIVLGILAVSTSGGGQNSFLNFTIGSLIYLVNIILTYLHNTNHIDWSMIYLSPFAVLLLSIAFGFWNLSKKNALFSNLFDSFSIVYLIHIVGATITLGFVAYAFATGNDPLIEALEDAILYTHIVMGFFFFAYVFFNFLPLFRQKLDVAKIVFKPLQFQLLYFRAGAVLVIFAILVNNQFFPIMQSFSGYYNALADHSAATEQYKLAEAYYKTALGYERQNHKSNYALASLAAVQGDNTSAGSYFRLAIQKKPTPYTFAALSNTLQNADLFFEAMFAIKDGLKVFPKSGELQNNLALLFEKSKVMDSSLVYLEKAKLNAEKSEIPEANLVAFFIKNNLLGDTEMKQISEKLNYNSLNANKIARNLILNQTDKLQKTYDFLGDSVLSMASYALLNNQTILNAKNKKYTDFPFLKLLENEANFNISKDIQTTHIFNEYYAGNKLKALEIMQSNLIADSSASSRYNQILFNTLLKKAKEIPASIVENEIKNKTDALKALKANPLSENIIKKSVDIFNKNKSENIAYEALLNAKKWKPESAEIQKLYILQCFKIHMIPYAKDGMEALKTNNLAEYKSFLPVYQAQIALVEKDNEGFN